MAKKEQSHTFNLLKPLETPKDYWDEIYDWLITRAKVVIIVVELLMVAAFGLKVLVDNNEKNKKQEFEELQVEATLLSSQYEQEFRKTQVKEEQYRILWLNMKDYNTIMQEVYSYTQNLNDEISIRLNEDILTITGYDELQKIDQLENAFKNSETFELQSVRDLSLDAEDLQQNRGRFLLTAKINNLNLRRDPIL